MPKSLQLSIVAGGRLLTQPAVSLENVPAQDFVRLLNVFKDFDVAARMPGWLKFFPKTSTTVTNQYTFGTTATSTGIPVTNAYLADVTELYNYRAATVRTGEYHSDPVSPFGWLPGPGTITTYHPYDSAQDGMISLLDLTAAIADWTIWLVHYPVIMAELVRGDGTRVIVAASQQVIKYFDYATATWVQIGSGFSNLGARWQMMALSGYLILNNGVDLPQYWQIGDAAVTPMHELREVGIASVGRIAGYNGFLFVGDVVEVKAGLLAPWMNGYAAYAAAGTTVKAANFTVLVGEAQQQFDVTTGAGTITATLPALTSSTAHFHIWIKKVDAGAGSVVTSPTINVDPVVLDAINDMALIMFDGARWTATLFEGGTIPALDAYGITPTQIRQYVPDEQAWGELGNPINWAPLLSRNMLAASVTIYLPFKPFKWTANKTRLAIVNGGPDGGTLGGQSAYPEGILVTAVGVFSAANGGVPITLEVTTDTVITYPRVVSITRWSDVSTFVGKQRMGNGSQIVCMLELNGVLVVYQNDFIFITRWTAQAKAPFALRQKYSGRGVPMFGDCVASVRNRYHLYPSREESFIMFDGLTDPVIHQVCEGARDLFFGQVVPTSACWAVDNPTLQSIWFVTPTRVMAYRYRADSEGVSEMDAVIGAACFARKPNGTADWFVLALTRFIYQWGLVGSAIGTWHRDGVSPTIPARLTSGLNSFKNQIHEKRLLSFTPIMSSVSPADVEMTIQIRGTHNPNAALSDFMTPAATIPDPDGNNYLPTCFQSTYMQDELTLTDVRDVDFRVSARLFEFEVIGGVQITRSGTG